MEDIKSEEFGTPSIFDEEQQIFEQASIPENDLGEVHKFNKALKKLTEEYDRIPKEEKKEIEKKIDETIIKFFEENEGKENIHIVAPSRTCVSPRIAYYFEKVFLKTFDFISDEKSSDVGLAIEEALKNIVGYRNSEHNDNTFYFQALVAKGKISCQFIDFNSGEVPERTMEFIKNNNKSKIHEDMEKTSEKVTKPTESSDTQDGHGWGTEMIGYLCDNFDCQSLIIDGKKEGHTTVFDIIL